MGKNANFDLDAREHIVRSKIVDETEEKRGDEFLISYKNRYYDIQDFLKYHPGGRTVFDYLKNRSLDKAFDQNPHSEAAFHLLEEFTVDAAEKYQKYEDMIDWNKPILRQVGTLGERYWEWVNLPVNRPVRLFESNLLENLTITPWYLVPIIWIPIVIYLLYSGYKNLHELVGNTLLEASSAYVFGIFLWSILEYAFHRKLFHFKPPASSKTLIALHFLLHGVHHKAPLDDRRLVFPPAGALLTAKVLVYIYQIFFSEVIACFIIAGTITGYIGYDLTHYYLHYGAPKVGTYMYTMKRKHNYHHFVHHELGFGISSKIWDHVFGTNICLRQLAKPIEW